MTFLQGWVEGEEAIPDRVRIHRRRDDFQADSEPEVEFLSYCIFVAYFMKSMICLYSHGIICL
jgi:hypothetical protein